MPADKDPAAEREIPADPRRLRRRRRLRLTAIITAIVLVAGAAGVGIFFARGAIAEGARTGWEQVNDWAGSLQDAAAAVPETVPTTTLPPPEPEESRSLLVVVDAGAGDAAFALIVRHPWDPAEMVMIPQGLLVQVPGYGEFTVGEAMAFGGAGLVRTAVANETGLRIDDTAALAPEALGDGLVVDVPVELFVEESDGSRRLVAPGPQELSTELISLLLTEQGEGDQFDWLLRQEAVWLGLLDAIGSNPAAAGPLAGGAADSAAAAELWAAVAGTGIVGVPPVDRVAMGGSQDALVPAAAQFHEYLATGFGHLLLSQERRPRVEILNGNGIAGSGIPVADTLIASGYYVFRSGNANRFDYETSLVIAQGDDAVDAAVRAGELLEISDVYLEGTAPSGVVDVSIIVGADLAAREV